MAAFLENLLTASLHGSIVILAVIALRLVLRKTPKKYICLLWLLAGIRLLMPIEVRSELSLQPEFGLPVARLLGNGLAAILLWVWGVTALGFGIYSLASYLKLKDTVREAVRIRGGWECDRIDTAFILGFIKPRIYIPMGMNRQSRKHILEHERTHLDKGDHWIKMIGFLALALHWFNPLVWAAYTCLCKDIEMACDERVVQFMELEERKSYSAALLSCSSRQLHFAASPVAFGEVSVKQRILSILNYKKPGFWISMLGMVAFFFVAVCLVTSPVEKAEPVIVEVPVGEFTENTPEQVDGTIVRLKNAWEAILSEDKYHLFFMDQTYEGGVGWQVNVYKDGENTLWSSTDHTAEEGRMVLEGASYKFIEGSDGGWVPYEEEDTLLASLLEQFDLDGSVITDIVSEWKTNDVGETYETLTFHAHSANEAGETVTRPMTVYFDTDGKMTGMRVENTSRQGADIFAFSNWELDSSFNGMDEAFSRARENIIPIENVHPSKLQEPTQDEQRMKDWGIQYRVDDDLVTRYGGEVWFCQSEGFDMTVHTDNEYWLERKTDTGWEKLEMIAQPQWEAASYTLGHGMYTMVFVDWSTLYGPLPGGTYRMGKNFEMMESSSRSCIGYAEFDIYYNESNSADQTAAVERCYAGLEELKDRTTVHYKVTTSDNMVEDVWYHNGDYVALRDWTLAVFPEDSQGNQIPGDVVYKKHYGASARKDGIGYTFVSETPGDPTTKIRGMELSTLSADFAGWELYSFEQCLYLSFFERSNHVITFPEGIGVASDSMVRFQTNWTIAGGMEPSAQLTYQFDDNGDLCYMEYKTDLEKDRTYTCSIRIFDDTAGEIDAKIKPYTEDLVVDTFSWEKAKAKYTDAEFNIREEGFVNNGGSAIAGPVEAAKLALKEYPDLVDYLSVDVQRDEAAGMWKVTIEAYVDYQSTYCYRDIYLTDSGATELLVYAGPIPWDDNRK